MDQTRVVVYGVAILKSGGVFESMRLFAV